MSDSRVDVKSLVKALVKYSASDLHIKAGRPPLFRINGKLVPAKMSDLNAEQVQEMIFAFLSEHQKHELMEKKQIDLSFKVNDLGRFRCNVFFQRGHVSAAIRAVPIVVPRLEDLGIPSVVRDLCHRESGLLLVTGATGSGKSTTMAGMIQHINETRQVHVLAVEDPIEFVYRDVKASISQREIGADATTFHDALYAGLRQDPDVIMIGEMRDRDTIQAVLTAAETGHLVISTLHTNDAPSTVDRILDVFSSDAQNQIRMQLASTLIGVVSQQLVPKRDGTGLVPACEIMIKSPAIEEYIIRNERKKIPDVIASSNSYYKMQTMNMALEKLVSSETITLEDALRASPNPDDLKLRLSGIAREEGYALKAS